MRGYPRGPLQSAIDRHQLLLLGGNAAIVLGVLAGIWVLFEWYVYQTSHQVISVVAGFSLLLGTQLLIFAAMASMLIRLHRESSTAD